MIPLRFPADADVTFAALRAWLSQVPFTVPAVCERRQVRSIYDVAVADVKEPAAEPADALDVLLRLFIDTAAVPVSLVQALCGEAPLAWLTQLGLLQRDGNEVAATVLCYPNAGLWLVSDLPPDPGRAEAATEDVVYPALTSSVRTFLSTLPLAPGARYLELCSGTGVAALLASAHGAARAVAVDITARSTVFARFNARLNGVALDARQGDLYAPVEGEQFDCIVAHPPYVPALATRMIFRDGGADGEQVTRAILRRAAEFLAVGGVLHCTCLVTARRGAPVLQRVREMLGPAVDQLDVLVLENGVADRHATFVRELLKAGPGEADGIVDQLRHFQSLGVERAELVTIVVRRHGADRPGTARTCGRTAATGWPAVQWALALQDFLASGGLRLDAFMALRPRLSPHVTLDLSYEAAPGDEDPWRQDRARLTTRYPLVSHLDGNAGDAAFLGALDGRATFREVLANLRQRGELPAALPEADFAATMIPLVQLGFVETDRFPFPS